MGHNQRKKQNMIKYNKPADVQLFGNILNWKRVSAPIAGGTEIAADSFTVSVKNQAGTTIVNDVVVDDSMLDLTALTSSEPLKKDQIYIFTVIGHFPGGDDSETSEFLVKMEEDILSTSAPTGANPTAAAAAPAVTAAPVAAQAAAPVTAAGANPAAAAPVAAAQTGNLVIPPGAPQPPTQVTAATGVNPAAAAAAPAVTAAPAVAAQAAAPVTAATAAAAGANPAAAAPVAAQAAAPAVTAAPVAATQAATGAATPQASWWARRWQRVVLIAGLVTLLILVTGGILWYVGRTASTPGSTSDDTANSNTVAMLSKRLAEVQEILRQQQMGVPMVSTTNRTNAGSAGVNDVKIEDTKGNVLVQSPITINIMTNIATPSTSVGNLINGASNIVSDVLSLPPGYKTVKVVSIDPEKANDPSCKYYVTKDTIEQGVVVDIIIPLGGWTANVYRSLSEDQMITLNDDHPAKVAFGRTIGPNEQNVRRIRQYLKPGSPNGVIEVTFIRP